MKNQKIFTEEVLFNHYMVSSSSENSVHCQIPFYINSDCYNSITHYAEAINEIAYKILKDINTTHKRLNSYIDNFPYKEEIFKLKCPMAPMFWTRFDTFRDENNNIYFAEFNYDKPCAQKEISLAGSMDAHNNINRLFEKEFKDELRRICEAFKGNDEKTNVAVLIDPCHYEELHLAYYFKQIFKGTNISILQVGPKNFSVKNNRVYAFGDEEVHVILRLFPTEYLYEVNDIGEIFNCFEAGRVLLLNDPRVIAIQAKSLFAYLWELVEGNSLLLSEKEKQVIRASIPYTRIFSSTQYEEVIKNKDQYVVKASFGRYSGEVYIGKLYTDKQWIEQIQAVLKDSKLHILQQVINIKKEYAYFVDSNQMNIPTVAFANFGTYIINENVKGLCIRWSQDFLTDNSSTWMCPIGVKDYKAQLHYYKKENRKALWDKVIERAAFEYNFTGAYDNTVEYVSLDNFLIDKSLHKELEEASTEFCRILYKTTSLVKSNFDMFSELLGIPEKLKNVVLNSNVEEFCAVGRIDFALDNNDDLKIFEFNSETPAGLVEGIGINKIIKEELNIPYEDPNLQLRSGIKKIFKDILKEFSTKAQIKNVGFVSTSHYEDLYTTSLLADICKELKDYNVVVGNVYDLESKEDKLYLYGTALDAIYRHFPLDWFAYEDELNELIGALNKNTFVINPTHTLITQSKALFAVIYELIGKGFYTSEEEEFINKYIPYTCLEPNQKLSQDCVVKPYLSREGEGVILSYEGVKKDVEDVIFQERINIAPFEMEKHSYCHTEKNIQFPVIGVFITGDKPSGVFTRMGDFITNITAMFVPTYIKNKDNLKEDNHG